MSVRQMSPLWNGRNVVGATPRAHLGGEDREHLTDLVLVRGIEERDVHFGTALALQIDWQQIGARREQHPDDAAPRYFVSPICDAIIPNTRLDGRASPSARGCRAPASASSTTNHHRAHGGRTASTVRVALRLAHVLRTEVLEHDAGRTNIAADALGQERFSVPTGPQIRYPIGRLYGEPRLSSAASSRRRVFAASCPTTVSSVHFGSMKSSRAVTLALDHQPSSTRETPSSRAAARLHAPTAR